MSRQRFGECAAFPRFRLATTNTLNRMAPCKGMAAGKAPKQKPERKKQMTETNKLNQRRKPGDCNRAGNAAAPPKRVQNPPASE